MGDEYGVLRVHVNRINAIAWCTGVSGVSRLIIPWWDGDTILACWAIGSVSGSLVKRCGDGYFYD